MTLDAFKEEKLTLLVAGADQAQAWMIVDTAVTDPTKSPRHRTNEPKIVPLDGQSLVGFAGHVDHAHEIIETAAALATGKPALEALLEGHKWSRSVAGDRAADFGYAFMENGSPQLVRIANGRMSAVRVLHLGSSHSFSKLQKLRHDDQIEHAPDALHHLMLGTRLEPSPSKMISRDVLAFFRLFPATTDREIGGWPTPYRLTNSGVELCTFAYAVTDPIIGKLPPGSVIPHGTAEHGGFTVSLTELGTCDGMVVYWRQRLAGSVFVRRGARHIRHDFQGEPTAFKAAARDALGVTVDLWIGDQPLEKVHSIATLRDQSDRDRIAVKSDGSKLEFVWLQNTEDSFRISGTFRSDELGIANSTKPPTGKD
jgi:hypothetical protein